mmetsp:Transcript_85514/g.228040  ORF Transcript_85514/g.228040 Transcript_85514/m.228040 type:complete len:203 (+) Transcript_85514:162-770(+)
MCPSVPSWSSDEKRSCVIPSRCFGMKTMWVGAWGLMSLKASTRSSSYTISDGICLARILSKMEAGSVSRRPACRILAQRPSCSHFSSAPRISAYTLPKTSSESRIRTKKLCSWPPMTAGGSQAPPSRAGSNLGRMKSTKTSVGKIAASARDSSPPARYGPSGSTAASRMSSCFFNSARAAARDEKAAKGGAALYMQPWIGAT